MDFMTAVTTCFTKYADFSGRARRSEYWWFYLFLIVANVLLGLLDSALGLQILGGIFALATIVPIAAAAARRLHDVDRSGWWLVAPIVPSAALGLLGWLLGSSVVVLAGAAAAVLAAVALVIWLATDTVPGGNRFGPAPK